MRGQAELDFLTPEAVEAQLDRISASRLFRNSPSLIRLLRFSVEKTTQGHAEDLKEYSVATEVLGRPKSFDPRDDTSVRVTARRLRAKLEEYYRIEGRDDPLCVSVPRGGYKALIEPRKHKRERIPGSVLRRLAWGILAGLGAAAVGVLLLGTHKVGNRIDVFDTGRSLRRLTFDLGLTFMPSLSPDGSFVAYASDRSTEGGLEIFVQETTAAEPVRLTHSNGIARNPSFSPDGAQVVFSATRPSPGIYVVSATGGGERKIAPFGIAPRFSPDGERIAYSVGSFRRNSALYQVSTAGGPPTAITTDVPWAMCPIWSPGGDRILFLGSADPTGSTPQSFDWWVRSAQGGKTVKTGVGDVVRQAGVSLECPESWLANGVIAFGGKSGSAYNIWQVQLSERDWAPLGPPQRVTAGAGEYGASFSSHDSMAFASVTSTLDLWYVPLEAETGVVRGEPERLTHSASAEVFPSVSRDGQRLVFMSDRDGRSDIWMKELDTGREVQLTEGSRNEYTAVISPGGERVAFRRYEENHWNFYVLNINGRFTQRVCEDCDSLLNWSPDGRHLVFRQGNPLRIHLVNVDTSERKVLLHDPKRHVQDAAISPDGSWVAFRIENDLHHDSLYIAPLQDEVVGAAETWVPIEGKYPLGRIWWSPQGGVLYFGEGPSLLSVWGQRLDSATKRPDGDPFLVLASMGKSGSQVYAKVDYGYGMTPDGLYFGVEELQGNVWLATNPQSSMEAANRQPPRLLKSGMGSYGSE